MTDQRVREIVESILTVVHYDMRYAARKDLENAIFTAWREGMQEASVVCQEVHDRGPICDEPEVFEALHSSDAIGCAAAIRARVSHED